MRKATMTAMTAIALALLASAETRAEDSVADFYRGKQIQLKIGFPPGSGYDLAGRLVSRHIGRHIPGNPTIVIQNIVGAGSLLLANQMFKTGARDGTALALVSNAVAATPLFSPTTAQFDPRKFNWIGSNAPEIDVVVLSQAASAKTVEDLKRQPVVVGATGLGGAVYDLPLISNVLLGARFKIVAGYSGTAEIFLATQRGEVQGMAGIGWSSVKANQLADVKAGRLNVVAQFGLKKHPDLPDVPLFDLPANEVDAQALRLIYARMEYGRPFLMPPDTPADRVDAIRTAFLSAMKDPALLSEAQRAEFDISPVSGQELEALTHLVMNTPPAAVARLRDLLEPASPTK